MIDYIAAADDGPNNKVRKMLNRCFAGLGSVGVSLVLALGPVLPADADDFLGIVYPARDLALSFGVGGMVTQVPAQVGKAVAQGEVLLSLDERMANIEVERRRVVLEDRSELIALEERQVLVGELHANAAKLFELTGGISQDEVQKLKLELADTRGRIDQARSRKLREELEFRAAEQERQALRLLAPVAGVITRLELDVGEWAKPGEAIVQLVDVSECYLRVSVHPSAARQLTLGKSLPVMVDGAAEIKGRVSYVAPVADAASGLVEIRVTFDNRHGRVRPGSSGRVRIGAG